MLSRHLRLRRHVNQHGSDCGRGGRFDDKNDEKISQRARDIRRRGGLQRTKTVGSERGVVRKTKFTRRGKTRGVVDKVRGEVTMGRDRYTGHARSGETVGIFEEEESTDGVGDVDEQERAREKDEEHREDER